ncbi:MAG: hypothetical protein KAR39_06430 [Thermoplasmata archaeon]|nr:hypothetical protein [Thermoplasmata archaeon]
MIDLEQIRRDVEACERGMNEEYYLNWSGQKDDLDTASVLNKCPNLGSRETVDHIAARRQIAEPEEERKLKYLHGVTAGFYLASLVKDLNDAKETEEAKLTIDVDGEEMAYRMSGVHIVNEDDRAKRHAIHNARIKASDGLNKILVERWGKLHNTAVDLGYNNYTMLYRNLKGINFTSLLNEIKEFKQRTDKLYREKMGEMTDSLGVSLEEAEKHDIAYLLRAKQFDPHFKKGNSLPALKATLKGLGIDMDSQKNIIVDIEEREKKTPRAFCAPLDIPSKIMLVTMPKGGYSDYSSLFHEAGHAEHLGNVNPDEPMEFKYLGDNSVTESFAFTLDYLLTDRNWVNEYIKMPNVDEYMHHAFVEKLYFVRRYGSKLEYEMKLHTDGLPGMDQVYKSVMEDGMVFKHPMENYLLDLDDGFYCAQYLRAWIFHAQLIDLLKEKFGEKWFLNTKSGNYLTDLWSVGQKYDVVELAQNEGFQGLDIEPLTEEILANLE